MGLFKAIKSASNEANRRKEVKRNKPLPVRGLIRATKKAKFESDVRKARKRGIKLSYKQEKSGKSSFWGKPKCNDGDEAAEKIYKELVKRRWF